MNMIDKLESIIEKYKTVEDNLIETLDGGFAKIEIHDFKLKNGVVLTRNVLSKKNIFSAVVIPRTREGKFVLVIQPRPTTKRTVGIEFPSGFINNNENPVEGAKREIEEETGYVCGSIEKIDTFYQDQGLSKCMITTFFADNCEKVKEQNLDFDELVEYIEVTYLELLELCSKGYITDVNTLICIRFLKEKYLLEKTTN